LVERTAKQATARYALATSLPSTSSGQVCDHLIRDEDDFNRHMDYIYWNPVKHDWCPRSQLGRIQVFTGWYEADGILKIGEKTSLSTAPTNSVSNNGKRNQDTIRYRYYALRTKI